MLNLQLDKSLIQHVDDACAKFSNHTCFIFGTTTYTYEAIKEASCQVANQLIAQGFQKGMRGAVFSLNDPLAFIALLGIIRAGGIWVPVNPRNSLGDNITLLKKFGCDALFFQDIFEQNTLAISAEFADLKAKVCLNASVESAPKMDVWMEKAAKTTPSKSNSWVGFDTSLEKN